MDHNDLLREALKNRRGFIDGSKLDKKEKKGEEAAPKLPALGEMEDSAAPKGSAIAMISALIPPPPPPGDADSDGSDNDEWNN